MKKLVNFARPIFLLLLVLTVIVLAAVLKVTGTFLVPVTIAIFVSLVFEPLIVTLNTKFKIPWIAGIFIVLTLVIVSVWIIASLLLSSIRTIIDLYPRYEERFTVIYKTIAGLFALPYNAESTLFQNLWGQLSIRQTLRNFAFSLSNSLIVFFKDLLLVLLFAVFFLLDLRYLRQKLDFAFGDGSKGKAAIIITDIIQQVTRYMSVKFFISLLTGVLIFLGTFAVGMGFPILWGFLAFILNFIPNFGSILSGVLTSVFALVQFWPKPAPVVFVAVLMCAVNFILGNIIEPRVQGRHLGLSPFIIIVSLSFWGWLWGFTGLILAVPMMVILKIICENVSILHPAAVLMGNYTYTHELQKEQEAQPQSAESTTGNERQKDTEE
ncbi:AI-2E family transporter [Treponema maltophilum]|uniref:AI-2E family transporter n=1 Tax=Treponema maltophilum TaxID=51160 RepID=UPI003D94A404